MERYWLLLKTDYTVLFVIHRFCDACHTPYSPWNKRVTLSRIRLQPASQLSKFYLLSAVLIYGYTLIPMCFLSNYVWAGAKYFWDTMKQVSCRISHSQKRNNYATWWDVCRSVLLLLSAFSAFVWKTACRRYLCGWNPFSTTPFSGFLYREAGE